MSEPSSSSYHLSLRESMPKSRIDIPQMPTTQLTSAFEPGADPSFNLNTISNALSENLSNIANEQRQTQEKLQEQMSKMELDEKDHAIKAEKKGVHIEPEVPNSSFESLSLNQQEIKCGGVTIVPLEKMMPPPPPPPPPKSKSNKTDLSYKIKMMKSSDSGKVSTRMRPVAVPYPKTKATSSFKKKPTEHVKKNATPKIQTTRENDKKKPTENVKKIATSKSRPPPIDPNWVKCRCNPGVENAEPCKTMYRSMSTLKQHLRPPSEWLKVGDPRLEIWTKQEEPLPATLGDPDEMYSDVIDSVMCNCFAKQRYVDLFCATCFKVYERSMIISDFYGIDSDFFEFDGADGDYDDEAETDEGDNADYNGEGNANGTADVNADGNANSNADGNAGGNVDGNADGSDDNSEMIFSEGEFYEDDIVMYEAIEILEDSDSDFDEDE